MGLERTPAAEILPGTAEAWCEAVATGRVFDRDLDTARIRRAFVTLAGTRTSWPAPLHFIEALPQREQLALTKQPIPADPARAAAAVEEVRRMLSGKDVAAEQGEEP